MSSTSSALWARAGVGAAVGACAGFLLRDLLPLETASSWVPGVVVGALLWFTRLRSTLVALVLACTTAWFAVGFTPVTGLLVRALVRHDPPRSADAVFVLASRLQRSGEPTAVAQSRLFRGVELLRRGLASRLILTDLPPPAPRHEAVAKAEIVRLGLTPPEILSLGHAESTREEAVRVGNACHDRGWNRLLVVSSPLHSRRACAALEHEGLEVVCVPAVETEYDAMGLSRPTDRFVAFRQAAYEWLALWVYRRRGWI